MPDLLIIAFIIAIIIIVVYLDIIDWKLGVGLAGLLIVSHLFGDDKSKIFGGNDRKEIKFTKFEVVKYPSARFNEIKPRLEEIFRIAEPEDKFKIWNGSQILVGFNNENIQAFMCFISDKDYMAVGRHEIKDEDKLKKDFIERGGLPDKHGFFGVSLAGNIAEYYGLGKDILANINMIPHDYIFVHVHSDRPKLIEMYKKIGMEIVGTYVDNGAKFIVMRTSTTGGDAEEETCPPHIEFQRIINDKWPRMKYRRRKFENKPELHWGQRKLHLSEVEFLTLHGDKSDTIVYAGSADGKHIKYLSESLFPNHKFILYDPSKFDPDLIKYSKEYPNRVEIHTGDDGFFTDEKAKLYNGILFISDIRTVPQMDADAVFRADTSLASGQKLSDQEFTTAKALKNKYSQEFEAEVIKNMDWQMSWCQIIKPAAFMLKFRLPYTPGKTEYLKGDLYMQTWAGNTSSETRLIGTSTETQEYDNTDYEEACYFLNRCARSNLDFEVDFDCPIKVNGAPLNNYDWRGELFIHSEYKKKFNDKRSLRDFAAELDKALGISLAKKYLEVKAVEKNRETSLEYL